MGNVPSDGRTSTTSTESQKRIKGKSTYASIDPIGANSKKVRKAKGSDENQSLDPSGRSKKGKGTSPTNLDPAGTSSKKVRKVKGAAANENLPRPIAVTPPTPVTIPAFGGNRAETVFQNLPGAENAVPEQPPPPQVLQSQHPPQQIQLPQLQQQVYQPQNLRPVNPMVDIAMRDFVQKTMTQGLQGIRNEWVAVAGSFPTNCASTLYEYNTQRNFPGGSPCLDFSRVHLSLEVPPQTEYIHANWVSTTACDLPKLILTQTPLDSTTNDFWRMIYQEKCRVIVMLCDRYENGKRNVPQYWPLRSGESKMYGHIRVQNNALVTPDGETSYYTKYHLTVSFRSEPAVSTMLYTCKIWKEGLIPESTFALLRLIRHVMNEPGLACIHGAAGAGRPGVFATIMIALRALMIGRPVAISTIALEIREQRMGAISTELQYVYIYRILCEYIQRKGIMKEQITLIVEQFNAYKKQFIEFHAKQTKAKAATPPS